jgi:AAA ATPase domain
VPLFELESTGRARNRLDVSITRGLSRFVGRTAEMQTLQAALARTQSGHGQVIGIVGEPGLGKSRLCFEFVAHCRRQKIPVFEAHCPAHGKNIPYLPIRELFRNYFDIKTDDDAAQARNKIGGTVLLLDATLSDSLPVLFEFMGVSDPNHPLPPMDPEAKQRQLYELMHRIVRAQDAQGQMTVTLIDDLHWVDAGSDGFISQLVNAVAGRRSLIVLNFRPEYVAAFGAKAHYQQLPLVPLGDAPLREMTGSLIGHDPSVTELSSRIIEWTSGNPFYTEELINALIEAGDLVGHAGHYRLMTTLERLVVPTNVRTVLAARIDRLPEAAKRLLQTAAVIGKEFSGPLLEAVTDLPLSEQAAALERLKAGDFLYERALYPVFEYAFKHPLTHEVAYQSQLQSRRAAVHAAVARALEGQAGDKLDEQAALLAHHCEAAGEVLNAARWYRRAAEWAGLNDLKTALQHWQRVRELAQNGSENTESTPLLIAACSAALAHGWRIGHSALDCAALFAEGCRAAERAGNLVALAMLNAAYGAVRGLNHAVASDYVHYPEEAVQIAECTGDLALRCGARAFLTLGLVHSGRLPEAKRVADQIIKLAGADPHLGADLAGFSPLLAAQWTHQRYIGLTLNPAAARRECARLRHVARDSGFPEQALWFVWAEAELQRAVGDPDGAMERGRLAVQLAEPFGIANQIVSIIFLCDGFVSTREWQRLRDSATDALKMIRERGAVRLLEPIFLAHLGTAHLELADLQTARATAQEGVAYMRESGAMWIPHVYIVLARAQIFLDEPAVDIIRTLDEYEALLMRGELHVYEGELHELRARLAEREGHLAERSAALTRAHECYTRFDMTVQAARIASLQALGETRAAV